MNQTEAEDLFWDDGSDEWELVQDKIVSEGRWHNHRRKVFCKENPPELKGMDEYMQVTIGMDKGENGNHEFVSFGKVEQVIRKDYV